MMATSSQQDQTRFVTADTVRQLWTTINGLKQAKVAPSLHNICGKAFKSFGWKTDETKIKVKDCVDCELLMRTTDPASQQDVYLIPITIANELKHDKFCFKCHDAGTVLPCSTCFRVYHNCCLSSDSVPFSCSACQILLVSPAADRELLTKQLESQLAFANTRGGPNFNSIPNVHSPSHIEQHRLLIARPVDLTVMRGKAAKGEYASAAQFLVDFQLLVHNMIILYGKESNLASLARDLLKQVRSEVEPLGNAMTEDDESMLVSKSGSKMGKRKQELAAAEAELARRRKKSDPGDAGLRSPNQIESVQMEQSKIIMPVNCGTGCNCDPKYRQAIINMQQQWLQDYKMEREKCLAELAEKLHMEFKLEHEKARTDLLDRFRVDLEQSKKDLDIRYSQQLKQEIQKQVDKHKRILSDTKKKQWCWQCEAEAIYHCCWNTAYCSVECQQAHWPQHRKNCRRKKQTQS